MVVVGGWGGVVWGGVGGWEGRGSGGGEEWGGVRGGVGWGGGGGGADEALTTMCFPCRHRHATNWWQNAWEKTPGVPTTWASTSKGRRPKNAALTMSPDAS